MTTVLEFDPGEAAQVDFGKGPEVLEGRAGIDVPAVREPLHLIDEEMTVHQCAKSDDALATVSQPETGGLFDIGMTLRDRRENTTTQHRE